MTETGLIICKHSWNKASVYSRTMYMRDVLQSGRRVWRGPQHGLQLPGISKSYQLTIGKNSAMTTAKGAIHHCHATLNSSQFKVELVAGRELAVLVTSRPKRTKFGPHTFTTSPRPLLDLTSTSITAKATHRKHGRAVGSPWHPRGPLWLGYFPRYLP